MRQPRAHGVAPSSVWGRDATPRLQPYDRTHRSCHAEASTLLPATLDNVAPEENVELTHLAPSTPSDRPRHRSTQHAGFVLSGRQHGDSPSTEPNHEIALPLGAVSRSPPRLWRHTRQSP